MSYKNNVKATDKVMNEITDERFLHLNKEDRIKLKFNLYHGSGKRKNTKKKRRK